jgi:hypothetical protein
LSLDLLLIIHSMTCLPRQICGDNDPTTHEFADRVNHVGVVTPKAVNPANDERVTRAQHVEQAPALGALGKASAHTGHAFIGQHLLYLETRQPRPG